MTQLLFGVKRDIRRPACSQDEMLILTSFAVICTPSSSILFSSHVYSALRLIFRILQSLTISGIAFEAFDVLSL